MYLQSPINYSNSTYILPLTFQLHKKALDILEEQDPANESWLSSKSLAKPFPTIKKVYHISYILCNPLLYLFVQSSHTNLLAQRETFGLQYICRAQLIIQTTHLHCHLLYNYVTSLLAYCRL